jgi:pSer/pThr/pTyr-binding forkhead associated (FHA) protein
VAKQASRKTTSADGNAAYLFVDDDERIVRFRLGAERVGIGRDQANDIWIEHPDVPKHALMIVRRDGLDVMKIYDGASVRLNGVVVTKMHRLYGGDRVALADREFIYGRDDTPPDFAIALTIRDDREPVRAVVLRQTRIRLGRRAADVVIDHPSISDKHLRIEAYSTEGLFICDLGSGLGTEVDDRKIDGRIRLVDGARIQIGRVQIIAHILDSEAHGLLAESSLQRARPKQVDTPLGARNYDIGAIKLASSEPKKKKKRRAKPAAPAPAPSEQVQAEFEEPPPTVIGSLAQLERDQAKAAMPRRTEKRPRPPATRSDSWRPPTAPADRAAPAPTKPRKRRPEPIDAQEPSVRISPELYERGRQVTDDVDGKPKRRRPEQSRRYASGRSAAGNELKPPARARKQVLHEKLTDVLDTNNVRDLVGDRYVAAYQNVEPRHPERDQRYRPGKPGRARLPTDQELARKSRGSPPADPFGVHRQVTHAGHRSQLDNINLTNMLDLSDEPPRLSRDRHALDPDAMPQQLREQEGLDAHRGDRGPVDDARRRRSREQVDGSQRPERDED